MYMKCKNNIINIILNFILVIIISYKFNNNLIFIYCIYNSLYFIFKNIFNIDYKELFLKNKSKNLIFNKCFFNTIFINIILVIKNDIKFNVAIDNYNHKRLWIKMS